jgi:hypothetical protein
MNKSEPRKTKSKWDWPKLRKEFLAGEWKTVKGFLIEKGIPYTNFAQTTGWAEEKKELQEKSIEVTKSKLVEQESDNIVEIRKRQARLARFMQLKGAKKLEDLHPETVDEARRLVVAGMKEERASLGMEGSGKQSLTQINIQSPKTNLDRLVESLDYEGVLKLIAELRQERDGRPRAESLKGGVAKVEEGKTV